MERFTERRETMRKKEIIVDIKPEQLDQLNSQTKSADEFIESLGLNENQIAKAAIISDDKGKPKSLRVTFKSKEVADSALKGDSVKDEVKDLVMI